VVGADPTVVVVVVVVVVVSVVVVPVLPKTTSTTVTVVTAQIPLTIGASLLQTQVLYPVVASN